LRAGSKKDNTLGVTLKQRLDEVRQSESPAPSELADYSDEEYALIRHAKQIVENKAEELVTKYSQLIEQSEATRLAETVKKVEKRMKVRCIYSQHRIYRHSRDRSKISI